MNWLQIILAGAGALMLGWPSLKPYLAKIPGLGKLADVVPVLGDPEPECLTNPAAKPPVWVAKWLESVRAESGGRGDTFVCDCLKSGSSLYDVARSARDRKTPGSTP